jgi:hypothetical protein
MRKVDKHLQKMESTKPNKQLSYKHVRVSVFCSSEWPSFCEFDLCKPYRPDDLTMKWYLMNGDILYLHASILLIKLGQNIFVGASQLECAQ